MTSTFRYRGATALLCVFLVTTSLSGCSAKKYEKIALPELEETIDEAVEEAEETSAAGAEVVGGKMTGGKATGGKVTDGNMLTGDGAAGQEAELPRSIELEDVDGAMAADGAAVAGLSSQESTRTRASRTEADGSGEAIPVEETADAEVKAAPNGYVVAIDAGHQAKANPEKEPVGPGSSTMKAKVEAGAVGISTRIPEYKLTLTVAQKVEALLEERGYQVVMIRGSNDVNISNAERAEVANESGADIFVRIHANALDTPSVHGTLSMCQTAKNPYNGELHSRSYSLSRKITDAVCEATGFKNRGVQETDTMSGINWSGIPVTIVEMGFMSNPEEDEKMAQEEYQDLIAGGIANGIDAYFGE